MTNFLHGSETINKTSGTRVVNEIRSSIVGLIGTAPKGTAGDIIICQNDNDDAQFGSRDPRYTIPNALNTLRGYGVGTVLVINVLDDSSLTVESLTVPVRHIAGGAVLGALQAGGFDYRLGTDIQIDGQALADMPHSITNEGEIWLKNPLPATTQTVNVTLSWRDPSVMTLNDVLGGVSEHGERYGLELFELSYATYGFEPKILIAPNFSSHPAVAARLEMLADTVRGVSYCDFPLGLTRDEALMCRGSQAPLGLSVYATSSERYRPCYPHALVADETGAMMLQPSSLVWAGNRVRTDNGTADPTRQTGWWSSCSNKETKGVLGLEQLLTARINDPNCDVNLLNAAGISTLFKDWGTGFRTWGNRTAAFPANTSIENFENVRRSRDIIEESIEMGSLQFMDADIDQAQADGLTEYVNGFLRSLKGRGAILGGECWFDPSRTTQAEYANGQMRIQYKVGYKIPNERITYESYVTFEYLLTLKRTTGQSAVGTEGVTV